jgi:Flp pilus assembly protein TadD
LLGFAIYLEQSGEGREMGRSAWGELQLSKAVEELSEGKASPAVDRLEAAARSTERHKMQLRVGIVYSLAGMGKTALPYLQQFVSSHPKDVDACFQLGTTLLKLKRESEAVNVFNQALALHPNDPTLLNNIGYEYAEAGIHLAEAEQLLKKAVAMRPREGNILDSLGWVYFKQGRLMESLAWLEKAHRLSPDSVEISTHLLAVRERVDSEGGSSPSG